MSRRKHPDARHGHRSKAENAHDELERRPVEWPEPDGSWHPAAAGWFRSLAGSAQATHYAQSDVATAVVLADQLSRQLSWPGPVSGNFLAAWLSGAGDLLATAGARRKSRLELERPRGEHERAHSAAVSSLAERRQRDGDGPA